jgi:NifU-like protein involved in Fe-S cluster formation
MGPMSRMIRKYHVNIIDHYENPRNVGGFKSSNPNIGSGLVGAPACGDVMKLQIEVDPMTGIIVDSKFNIFGGRSAIKSSSLVTEWVIGQHINDVIKLKNTDIAEFLKDINEGLNWATHSRADANIKR